MTVGNLPATLRVQILNECLTMLFLLFVPHDPIKTLMTGVDVGLQILVFTGDLSASTGLDILVSLALRQTIFVSRLRRS